MTAPTYQTYINATQQASANPQVYTSAATTAGQCLVAIVGPRTGSSQSVSTITDNGGNTWSKQCAGWVSGSNSRCEIWTAPNAASATSFSVTLTTTLACSFTLLGVGGYDAVTLVDTKTSDGTASGDSTSDTSWGAGSLLPTSGGDFLLVHGVSWSTAGTVLTFTPPSGYTAVGYVQVNGSTEGLGVVVQQVTAASGSYGGSITTDLASVNGFAAIAIKGAAGGGGGGGSTARSQVIWVF